MFNLNTIKSKLVLMTLLMFITLCIVMVVFSFLIYSHGKTVVLKGCGYNIEIFKEKINQDINELEDNASDLALLGEVYFEYSRDKTLAENMLTSIFYSYPKSLGGGIWFEPYTIDKNKKRSCMYAYKDSGKIIIDNNFESIKYDYLKQSWYNEIKSSFKDKKTTYWSKPYYENQGSKSLMITVGSGIYSKGKLVGISTVDWKFSTILDSILKIEPTPNSFALFADVSHDYILVSTDKYLKDVNLFGKSLKNIPWFKEFSPGISSFVYHDKKYISYSDVLDNGMVLIINVPEFELFRTLFLNIFFMFLVSFSIISFLSSVIYIVLTNNVINPIDKLSEIAKKIKQGSLDTEFKVEKPEEFEKLASTFNMMTNSIKKILHEREHYLSELYIAKDIQKTSLPSVFPPFPDRKDFDIYASMEAAKQVGGDFYDFFFINENKLMFSIADVSGKGIPAALFMMTVKTIVNNLSHFEQDPKKLINRINKVVCENNKQGFFVTMLIGIIDLTTGHLSFINAGHNPPLIRRNGKFEYLKMNTNLVLGMVEDFEYNVNDIQLNDNDALFLYTDGITEAANINREFFGEKRLFEFLNENNYVNVSSILNKLKMYIHEFTADMPQSDDMTMLVFQYNKPEINTDNPNNIETFRCMPIKENYKIFNKWLNDVLDKWNIDKKFIMNIELSCEEIYTNIFSYGYPNGTVGTMEVIMKKENGIIIIEILDDGIAYNPLEKDDPNINLELEERGIGGWGIYMVKQMSNNIQYSRENEKNILTLEFLVK